MGRLISSIKTHARSGAGRTGASSPFFTGSTAATGLPAGVSNMPNDPAPSAKRPKTKRLGGARTPLSESKGS